MTVTVLKCLHCEVEIRPRAALEYPWGGETRTFCCRGCLGAFLLVLGAGLADYYRRRTPAEPGLTAGAYQMGYDDAYLGRFVYISGERSAIDILIEGIRCASCAWLNERIVGRLPGVADVRVNYATGRARVTFDPDRATPAAIFRRIAELGYVPRPYTRSAVEGAAAAEKSELLVRFGTAFFLTMQLMAYSFALYAGYFQGISPQDKLTLQLFSLLVTTPVIFYSGWPFLAGAWRGLANRAPGMDLLIAVGALSSYFFSVHATITGGEAYFETAAMIVTLILAGRLLEQGAKRRAAAGVERLLSLAPAEACRLRGDEVERVEASELEAGDTLLVVAGERFPADGTVIDGTADVDESPATGEPMPVVKGVGSPVIAGSINLNGALRVRVERPARESFVARVARMVEEAQERRAPVQRVADRVAALFVPAVVLTAGATLIVLRLAGEDSGSALMTALAVLLIACPCALGLATPTAVLTGTGVAAARGVIFRGGDVLERLSRVTCVVFDKTGTVTCGRPEVVQIAPAAPFGEDDLLSLAAAVEAGSQHPLARGIIESASAKGIASPVVEEVRSVAGGGVTGMIAEKRVALGNGRFLKGLGVILPETAPLSPGGGTAVYLACDGVYAGAIVMRDRVRDSARSLVDYFGRRRLKTSLVSGDRKDAVGGIAGELGIAEAHGDLLPEEKLSFLERLQSRGERVLMVGDGINDAPALAAAHVGCAVPGGTDIAVETSDLILTKPDLGRLAFAHRVSRKTMSVIRQNIAWAFIYNAVGIPLAMSGRLTPLHAAGAMALSSLCVVGNSLRLLRLKPDGAFGA